MGISTASPTGMMSRCSSSDFSQDSPTRFGREESPTRRVDFDKSPAEKQSISEDSLQHRCIEAHTDVFENELQTEALAELQDKKIRENFGDLYDFEFYCDP